MEPTKEELRLKLFTELESEEDTENQLIWLYTTLLDLGVENCLESDKGDIFRKGMIVLRDESLTHKTAIHALIAKYK
jgi:hypothetical protein